LALQVDLFEQLERHARARPGEVAMQTISGGVHTAITFRQLVDQCRGMSRIVHSSGIEAGSRVALLLPNDHTFGIALLGAASAGAVIVPLDPAQEVDLLCAVIAHADCRLLICAGQEGFTEQGRAIRNQLPELAILTQSRAVIEPADDPWPLVPRTANSEFLLMYTGGTTGAPKAVQLSLKAVFVTIRDTLDVLPLSERDHVLSILPLFHIMAIQANLLGPLYAGARISYLQSRDPQAIVDAFREQGITLFLCVPLFYYQLHRRIFGEIVRQSPAKRMLFHALLQISGLVRRTLGWNAGQLLFRTVHQRFGPRLRGFGVGAARFAPEIAEDLHNLGFSFFQGYGMTETSGLATISPLGLMGGISCGRPLRNVEIRIHAPDAEGSGEILLRGANLMKGYWKEHEATSAAMDGGWLHTGDIGYLSGSNLHVIGRQKEVIVLSSGKNIFPEPLELWFQNNCPLIQEICIFGHSANASGPERLHAAIVPDAGKMRELGIVNIREELRYQIENLNRRLTPHEKLQGFDIRLEPLPRTAARKLQRFRIQEEFGRDREPPGVPGDSLGSSAEVETLAVLRRMIAHIRPGREIEPWMNFELDLSFDSLERAEFLANVQETFGIEIAAGQAADLCTIADVMALANAGQPLLDNWAKWRDILREPLSASERAMADRYLGARPWAAPFLFLATRIFCLAAKLLLRYRAVGPRTWSNEGPLIILANHQSYLDFPLIAGSLPYAVFRRIFTLSTSRLHRSSLQSWFGRAVRAVPIDPDSRLRIALRLAFHGLRNGMVLCVFPEGHRSIDENLQPFRLGTAILAMEAGAPTVPVGIQGTGSVWGRASRQIKLKPVHANFGALLCPRAGEDYTSFNHRLQDAVRRLISNAP
jgi:long-chain acyl-CoA synthetase